MVRGEDVWRLIFYKTFLAFPNKASDPEHKEQRFVVAGSQTMIEDTWKHLGTFDYNQNDRLLFQLSLVGFWKDMKQEMYI